MKKMNKRLLTLLLAGALVIGNAVSIPAITTETLTEESQGTTQVSGENAKGAFSITMKSSTDNVEIYQIASMKWTDGTYEPVAWVEPVANWFTTNYPSYDTPAKLAAAASSTQSQVLQELFGRYDYPAETDEADKKTGLDYETDLALYKVASGNITAYLPTDAVYAGAEVEGLTAITVYVDASGNKYKEGDTYGDITISDSNYGDLTPSSGYSQTATGNIYLEGEKISDAAEGYFSVQNVNLGMYMVLGTVTNASITSNYAPLVVNVIPEKDGANGNWYLKDDISASMKAADIYMEKTINGKPADEVRIGEEVQFEINFRTPQYAVRDTTSASNAAYTLTFDDTLSPAFTMDDSSVKVEIKGESGNWTELTNDSSNNYYNAIIAKERASTAAPTLENKNFGLGIWGCSVSHFDSYVIYENAVGVDTNADGEPDEIWYYYYYFRDGAYHLLQNDVAGATITGAGSISYSGCPVTPSTTRLATLNSSNGYCIRALYSRATGDNINHGWQEFSVATYSSWYKTKFGTDYNPNIFNITFNYEKLLAESLANRELRITYKATVNEKATAGTETNTNVATMKYETNEKGTLFDTISDTVNAYTYSLQLVKMDGTDQTPLSNAKFNLYKEAYYFDDAGNYDSTVGSGFDTPEGDGLLLSFYENKEDYYLLPVYTDDDPSKDLIGTRVFVLYTMSTATSTSYFTGTITSNGTADGVKVVGLDSGNYILKETELPSSAYNELAEDILFSIDQLADGVIESTYGGSLKAFQDAAGNVHEDGNYPITVLNYKGVTLPSTGGIGTTIFIILGIFLMLTAMLLVIIKNKKTREMATLLLAAVVLTASVFSAPVTASAVNTITANDSNGVQVVGDRTTSFVVDVRDDSDEIEVYQIAQMLWDDTESTYHDVEWVYDVKQWLTTTNGSVFSAYDTPEKLGAAETSVQTAFWDALLADKDTNNLEVSDKVDSQFVQKSTTAEGQTIYTVTDRPFGIYLIKGRNGNKIYQPLTVNVLPTKEGPAGHFFLKSNITGSLKFATVSIEKYINDAKYTTVKTGDVVRFTINGEVPEYPEKDASDTTKYPLSLHDMMSSAFKYNEGTATVKYYTTEDGWQELDPLAYTMVMSEKATGTTTSSYGMGIYTSGTEKIYVHVYLDGSITYYDCYALDSDGYQLVKLNDTRIGGNFNTVSTISNATVIAKYNALNNTTVTSFARSSTATWEDLYNVTFDYEALKLLKAEQVQLEYTATVTADAQAGQETNTNTAYLYYQKNAGGEFDPAVSTVNAYTYGMNLVKLDGESTTRKPLAGATFHLYEQMYLYVPDAVAMSGVDNVPSADTADFENYKFAEDIYGGTTAPTGYTSTASAVESLDNLLKVTKVTDAPLGTDAGDIVTTDTYYRKVKVEADATPCIHDGYTKEHYHIYACVLINGSINSVATEAGVTINGLEPATYVLRETQQPEGYNILKEAIIFEINDVTEQEITDNKAATHATFRSDDGLYYPTGIYPIEVTNYKGTQLPSTGGVGTVIFTFTGITLMISVMFLLVIVSKRRRESEL